MSWFPVNGRRQIGPERTGQSTRGGPKKEADCSEISMAYVQKFWETGKL